MKFRKKGGARLNDRAFAVSDWKLPLGRVAEYPGDKAPPLPQLDIVAVYRLFSLLNGLLIVGAFDIYDT
jgi:hypothetical protein